MPGSEHCRLVFISVCHCAQGNVFNSFWTHSAFCCTMSRMVSNGAASNWRRWWNSLLQFGASVPVRFWGYEYPVFLQPSKGWEMERERTSVNLLEGKTNPILGRAASKHWNYWGICSGSKLIFLLSNRWLVWRLCSCSKWFKVSQIPLLPVKSVVWRQARAFIYLFSIKEEEQQNHAVVTADGKERTGARGAIKIEGSPDVDCKLKYCLSSLLIAPNVILFLWNSFSESVCMRNICSLKSRPTIWINYQYLAAAHY